MYLMIMGFYRKSRGKDAGFRRMLPLILFVLFGISVLVYLIRTNALSRNDAFLSSSKKTNFPEQTKLSFSLEKRNRLPPRNLDLFPSLKKDHIKIVLYVHNRPQYFKVVVESLSQVEGIGETLLIVSHDGYFEEMNAIVEGIRFCQVKQIFTPYTSHLFPSSFPGVSKGDCQ